MKTLFATTAALALVSAFAISAQAQNETETIQPSAPIAQAPSEESAPAKQATAEAPYRALEAKPSVGGDLRAPSPKIFDKDRRGYFQAGIGTGYGMGLASDSLMYNVNASYNFNMDDRWTLKGLADMYFGSGSVSSRIINVGVGADFFLNEMTFMKTGLPYIQAEAALGNDRDALERTGTGLALGTGAGFKFQASELNWDIGLHYSILTSNVASETPSVASLRAALNF